MLVHDTITSTPRGADAGPVGPVAFLLPGLGDHHLGMGAHLARDHAVYAETLQRSIDFLDRECDLDVRPVLREAATAGPDLRAALGRGTDPAREVDDRLAQPALFAVEHALAVLWDSWGVRPSVMAGYSLGEYVAACLSGVLSWDDALLLVGSRAEALSRAPRGSMLAIGADAEVVSGLLGDEVWVSGFNTPGLTVVAGEPGAVDAVASAARARGVVHRAVASSFAFHTPMMEPVAAELTRIAGQVRTSAPVVPYFSNVTGRLMVDSDAADPGYWARHLCSPVQWGRALAGIGDDHVMVQVGPGQTLCSMAAEVRGDASRVVSSMRHQLQDESDSDVLARARALVTATPAADATSPLPGAADAATDDDPTAERIRGLWRGILGEGVAIDRGVAFFDVGGNSLLASRLALRIRREFGTEVTLRHVYEHPSVAAQAALVRGEQIDEAAGAPAEGRAGDNLLTLPNGLVVSQQNEAETLHFYDDIFEHRGYVRHGVEVPAGATVVDVGGNIGLFTLFAHTEAPGVRLLTFEPAPPMAEHLRRNVARHSVDATVFEMGLADVEGTADFEFYPRSSGMSTLVPDLAEEKRNLRTIIANQGRLGNAVATELADVEEDLLDVRFAAVQCTVALRRLSDVIREEGLARIDLLKVDVQKAEQAVFDGIDDEHWPLIRQVVAEVHDGSTGRVARLRADLERRGFSVVAIQDDLYEGTDIHNLYAVKEDA